MLIDMNQKTINKCPTCKQKTVYDKNNPFRPFCSERCKLIDLGQWASEEYKIPSNEQVDHQGIIEPEQDDTTD